MESFKSFGNFLQILIGDWRHREKIQNFGCREKHSSTLTKTQQSGHLNRPLFRYSVCSFVCLLCRLSALLANRPLSSNKLFDEFRPIRYSDVSYFRLNAHFRPNAQFRLTGIWYFRPNAHFRPTGMWYFRPNAHFRPTGYVVFPAKRSLSAKRPLSAKDTILPGDH